MATRLDRQIEELVNIVEYRLNLCTMTRNGIRCTLPANHEKVEPHFFPIEFLQTRSGHGALVPLTANGVGTDRNERGPENSRTQHPRDVQRIGRFFTG
jgi:hypothetical protein